jgi:trigger factor
MLNIGHEEAENLNSQFRFNINEIQVFEPSQINEDFFKKFYGENSEVNTVEEFRMKIENEISASFAYSSDQKFAIDARDKLITENVFALPEEFLKRWLKAANKGISDEEIEKDFEPFLKDLHWQLIKKSISKTNNLVVEEEEIKTFARQLAMAQYNQHGIYQVGDEQLSKLANIILEKEEERERIYRRIFENKIMQVIREKAGIDIHEISREEFYEMMK